MALNWTMLSPDRSPVPLPDEQTIRTIESGVELTVLIPDAPPSGSSSSGGSGGSKSLKEMGRLWLTDKRLIFVADTGGDSSKPSFDSLSVPLTAILSSKFEQPFFGANFLSVDIKPAHEGGLTEGSKAEIRLKDKGIFEFASSLDKTRERAIYMKRLSAEDEEGLPAYHTPSTEVPPSSAIPEDNPPGYDA